MSESVSYPIMFCQVLEKELIAFAHELPPTNLFGKDSLEDPLDIAPLLLVRRLKAALIAFEHQGTAPTNRQTPELAETLIEKVEEVSQSATELVKADQEQAEILAESTSQATDSAKPLIEPAKASSKDTQDKIGDL